MGRWMAEGGEAKASTQNQAWRGGVGGWVDGVDGVDEVNAHIQKRSAKIL